jgi:SNF2 family DNA or RNA helicase
MDKYPPVILKSQPMAHQQECLEMSWNRESFALLMEMGTGKTKIVIDTIAGLAHEKKINGALIIAPKGVYLNWSKTEIPKHMPDATDYYIHAWSSYQTQAYRILQDQIMRPSPDAIDIFLINIEALNSEKGMAAAMRFLEAHDAITVIDESTCIKNPGADRTKRAFTLANLSKYRRIMTGTPITQSPLDLFSQFKFLDQGILEFTSFTAFRAYYAEQQLVRMGNRAFNKVVGFRNLDKLQARVAQHSYRKLKTECVDLPEKIYQVRYVELTDEQRKIYDRLKDEALIQLAEEETLTVTSALTMILRLQQITCGHMKLDNGVTIDIPNNRLPALMQTIEESQGKVIIWAHFRRDVEQIEAALRGEYGPQSAVTYYGGTTDAGRADALERFEHDPNCRFFVGTQGTGGRGLTLVQSWTTIYYSNGYNLEHRLQSEDRNHRIGQKHNVTIIDIVCSGTIDPRIMAILKAKKNLADLVLDSWRSLILEDVPY